MTVLGKHTAAEIRDLALQTELQIASIQAFLAKTPAIDPGVLDTWVNWLGRWRPLSDRTLPLVTMLVRANPLVDPAALADEADYAALQAVVNRNGTGIADPGDLGAAVADIRNAVSVPIPAVVTLDMSTPALQPLAALDAAVTRKATPAAAAGAAGIGSSWWKWALGIGVLGGIAWKVKR